MGLCPTPSGPTEKGGENVLFSLNVLRAIGSGWAAEADVCVCVCCQTERNPREGLERG